MDSYFNNQLAEVSDIFPAFGPVDLNGQANNGTWISLRDYHRCVLRLIHAVGTSGDTVTLTVNQATSSGGAGSKALNFTHVRYKTLMTTPAQDTWTVLTPASSNSYSHSGTINGTDAAASLVVIEIDIETQLMDDANNFHWIQLVCNQPGHTMLGVGEYQPYSTRHAQSIPVSCLTAL